MASSIFIENLSPKTDVSALCEIFGKYGRILSANIEIDSRLSSLCKGHISYDTPHSAHYAVKEMNGRNHFGRPVYVKREKTFDCPADSTESGYYKKVFVKNIDTSWDDYHLIGEFERFGEIVDAKVSQTDGQSNGYGFVQFQKHSSAKMAVEAMHNKVINNKKLVVQPFMYKDNVETTTDIIKKVEDIPIQPNNLFIKNLPRDMDENELKDVFKKFGAIQSVRVATDSAQNSKGYGFVCFHSEMVAAKAQKQMDGLSYKSKILEVSFYKKKSDHPQSHAKMAVEAMHNKGINNENFFLQSFLYKDNVETTTDLIKKVEDRPIQSHNLFIKNLPRDMDDNELRDLFKKFGTILSVKVATDNAQKSKGYGFVCFHSGTMAAKALRQMDGLSYKSKILEVSFYKKKSDHYPAHSKVKEPDDETFTFFPSDKKTVFSFSAKG